MDDQRRADTLEPRRRIVGMDRELRRLERWLTDPLAETRLFSITGIGGIGKTTLLVEMARLCRTSSALTLWVDGRGELASSGSFLSSLESSLESEYGRRRAPDAALLPYIVAELAKQRTVLLLDNGETIERLESWLLSSFLPRLQSAGVLVVVASRNGLPPKWHVNPYWGSRIESFPLQLFTREQSLDYLRGSGLENGVQLEVAQRTEGHPLLLALTVDLLLSGGRDAWSRLSDIPAMLSGDWLREAASPALHRALTALSLLPAADQSTLNDLLDEPLDAAAYYELGRLSFIRSTPQGLALHPVVSRLLRLDYAHRHPAQFQTLRHTAFKRMADGFHDADRRTQMHVAAHVLELYREYLPSSHAYADFTASLRPGELPLYRPEDLPSLHRFLADSLAQSNWHSELVRAEDCHAVLDEIARHSPEGICVLRLDDGKPIAFCAGFRLDASAAPLLERYAPSFLPMLGEERNRVPDASSEASDTLCVLLAAVDTGQSLYRPEELGALLMQQWLIHMTAGWRGMMVSADPQLNSLLALMGFQDQGRFRRDSADETELTRWELDFRHTTFEQWVRLVIRQMHPELADHGRHTIGGDPLSEDDIRAALRSRLDPDELQRLGLSGTDLQARIRSILSAETPPFPLTRLEQRILQESFLRGDLNKNQLAETFHMSRTTFYRHSRQAMSHLTQVLNSRL
ncbi:bacterio-opsin activator [Cohnella hongkongensis]|uniref:Bacterio-opsin activator n=1 Tax=Cohnella hongkongensis TaxID=178337 RepID=A0ABV9F9L3_9BACL